MLPEFGAGVTGEGEAGVGLFELFVEGDGFRTIRTLINFVR